MQTQVQALLAEVKKAVSGKDQVIERVLTAILAGGHILLEDIPGVGKTTLALAMSRALGLTFGRVQFTPDVVPSDIVGFTIYDQSSGQFSYHPGAVLTHFFLADEINRTSSKTQSALLQVMQEGRVTVDGEDHPVPKPFVVMATQNPVGTAGTQMLPEAQLDRFMIKVSMGYPDADAQVEILQRRETRDPLETVQAVTSPEEIVRMQEKVRGLFVDEKIYRYITSLAEATRSHESVRLGVSPRGALAAAAMARANAFMNGRDYVVPEDVREIFADTCRHRLILTGRAGLTDSTADGILEQILDRTEVPVIPAEENRAR